MLARSFFHFIALALAALALTPAQAVAESALPVRTQVIEMQAGWNAIWLEVEPLETTADAVFAGTPVDVCARFFRTVTSVEYIKNPAEKPFNQEGWGVWYAPAREDAVLKTLHRVQGHKGYLVHATQAFQWSVAGRVEHRPHVWKHGAFNLVGFPLDAGAAPTFGAFFAGSEGRVGGQIFRLVDGRWLRALPTATMRAGEACWILAEGDSSYQGPITLEMNGGVLDFGAHHGTLGLKHINSSPGAQGLTAELIAGLPVERVNVDVATLATSTGAVAGPLPAIASGEGDVLTLRVRRDQMNAAEQTALLKLSDGAGAQVWVPLRATK